MAQIANVPAKELEKLKKVLEDKVFAERFGALNDLRLMQVALEEKDVFLTPEEIYSAAAMIASEQNEEMDEELLDLVSGGKTVSFWIFEINLQKPKWWPW